MTNLVGILRKYGLLLLLGVIIIFAVFRDTQNRTITYDTFGYYFYLPALFHLHDIALKDMGKVQDVHDQYAEKGAVYQIYPVLSGRHHVIRYPMGLAIAYSPAFIFAYITSFVFGIDHQYGFSPYYTFIILLWSCLIAFLGMYYLFRFLKLYVSEKIAFTSILLIFLGTNYMFHSMLHMQGLMSHNYLFTFYALLLYNCKLYDQHEKPQHLRAIFFFMAMIFVTRLSEAFCLLLPALFLFVKFKKNVVDRQGFSANIKLLLKAAIPGIIIISLQLAYWQYVTHVLFFDSYGDNAGESIEWRNPYILETLFSFRKGLFIYTPLSLFMLAGFYIMFKQKHEWFKPMLLYSLLSYLVIASWTCWWYSESFGSRALIPMYAVWALPFALIIEKIYKANLFGKGFFGLLILGCVSLNIFQSWQIKKGILPPNWVSRDFYFSVFGQTQAIRPEQIELLLDKLNSSFNSNLPDEFKSKIQYEFSSSLGRTDILLQDSLFEILEPLHGYSKNIELPMYYLNNADYKWAFVEAQLKVNLDTINIPVHIVTECRKSRWAYNWRASSADNVVWKKDSITKISGWVMIPKIGRNNDRFKVYVWSQSELPVKLVSLKLDIYRPKKNNSIFFWN